MKSVRTSSRGRPRAFDVDQALDKAMRVFWKRGYEGTSLPDLTEAMGINRPSLYAAFGNKEALFRKALDRYMEKGSKIWREAMERPTAREAVEHLLCGVVGNAGAGKIRGCLLVQGALTCGEAAEPIRQELAKRRAASEMWLRERFERAARERDLPEDVDAAALAKYVTTVVHGMAVQAAGGAGPEELMRVAEIALRAWPSK